MAIKKNTKAITFLKSLVEDGKYDAESSWSFSADDGNSTLGPDGDNWEAYSNCHLAIDDQKSENTKSYYKYPVAKEEVVYRSGVIAAKSRAAQQGENDISDAADMLLQLIDEREDVCADPKKADKNKKKKNMDSVNRMDFYDADYEWDFESRFKKDLDGYLTGRAVITNVGVFTYLMPDGSIQRELRLPEEVFSEDSMNSLKHRPVTMEHPTEQVDVSNVKDYNVGNIGSVIMNNNLYVSADMVINDKNAIDAIENGKVALSCGYIADVEYKNGNWCGVEYDAIQRNIRYNHVAIVDKARAGDAAKIRMDSTDTTSISLIKSNTPNKGEQVMEFKTVKLDGVEYKAEGKVLETLHSTQKKVDTLIEEVNTVKSDASKVEAERDSLLEQVAKLREDNENLVKSTPDVIKEAVNARMVLLDAAKNAGVEVKDDMSDIDIKKSVIIKAFPKSAEKLDGKDESYITAYFDSAVEFIGEARKNAESAKSDSASFAGGEQEQRIDANAARLKMMESMKNNHKKENK